jgi:hypothetical protein
MKDDASEMTEEGRTSTLRSNTGEEMAPRIKGQNEKFRYSAGCWVSPY